MSRRPHEVSLDGKTLRFTSANMLDKRFKMNQMYSRSVVGGRDLQDTVGIDLKCDFDLRNTTRSRRNTDEFEPAE